MLEKETALVLHQVKYGDASALVHLYTRQRGRVVVQLKISSSKKDRQNRTLYIPLSLLEVELDFKENRDIHYIKECRIVASSSYWMGNPYKSSMAIFLEELLFRLLPATGKDCELYDYLDSSVLLLGLIEHGVANFHLLFLLNLTRFLGFYPNTDKMELTTAFDLRDGIYIAGQPGDDLLTGDGLRLWNDLVGCSFDRISQLVLSQADRRWLLHTLLRYYQLHLPSFGRLKSLDILHSLY